MAHAIFSSPLPVLCGVGHEVDTTIADLVADMRAATPTHAAQMLWSERETLMQGLDEAELRLIKGGTRFVDTFDARLAQQEKGLGWLNPKARVDRLMERLETVLKALGQAGGQWIDIKLRALDQKSERLETLYGPEFWKLHDARIDALGDGCGKKQGRFWNTTGRTWMFWTPVWLNWTLMPPQKRVQYGQQRRRKLCARCQRYSARRIDAYPSRQRPDRSQG